MEPENPPTRGTKGGGGRTGWLGGGHHDAPSIARWGVRSSSRVVGLLLPATAARGGAVKMRSDFVRTQTERRLPDDDHVGGGRVRVEFTETVLWHRDDD
jgi:hypothetical protein